MLELMQNLLLNCATGLVIWSFTHNASFSTDAYFRITRDFAEEFQNCADFNLQQNRLRKFEKVSECFEKREVVLT